MIEENPASSTMASVLERRHDSKVRSSLYYSMLDGSFGAFSTGLADAYFIPFGLALHASTGQIGFLAAFPALVGALIQGHASFLTHFVGGRKPTMCFMVMLQSLCLCLLPFILVIPVSARFPVLLGLVTCYMMFAGLASPMYGTLLAEYLPSRRRSGYFGWRNRILGIIIVAGSLIAGLILYRSGREGLKGFALLFALAGGFRFFSWFYQRFLHEKGAAEDRRKKRRRTRARRPDILPSNFLRFVLFTGLLMGSINLAAPFFPVYLLQGVGVSYMTYTILIAASQAMMYFLMAVWGREADSVGNMKIIKVVTAAMPLIPISWILARNTGALFAIQVAAGILWSGYNLCITNFIYDAMPSAQRVRATVIFNMFNGATSFVGTWLGGQLLSFLPPLDHERFFMLALLSMSLQIVVVMAFLPFMDEVRPVRKARSIDLFYSVLGIRPLFTALREGIRFAMQDEM